MHSPMEKGEPGSAVQTLSTSAERPATHQSSLLDALVSISRKVAAWTDEHSVFQSIVEDAQEALQANRTMILLPEQSGEQLRMAAHCGFRESDFPRLDAYRLDPGKHPLVQHVLKTGEAIAIADTQVGNHALGDVITQYGFRAFYAGPLRYGDEMVGVLGIAFTDSAHIWTEDEIDWLTAMADQAAVALIMGRTMRDQRRSLVVREALHTASQRLQSAPDVSTVVEATLEGVLQVVPCLGASLHLLNEDGQTASVVGMSGYDNRGLALTTFVGYTYPADDSSLNSRTLLQHEAFYLDDFQEVAEKWSNTEMPTLRAWMSVPLISNNKCLGKITVDHERAGVYGPEELAIVQTFAAHAAVALERARLYAEANSRAAQFSALARSARALVQELDLTAVNQAVVDNARALTAGEACLMMYRAETNTLHQCAYTWTRPWYTTTRGEEFADPAQSLCGQALREQRIITVQDLLLENASRDLPNLRVRSAIVLPLSVGEDRLGVLKIAWEEPNRIDREMVNVATAFADHAALAIHNARQHDEMVKREQERTRLLRQLLTAQENERKRVALELHDGPLQSLGVGLINADALRKRMQSGLPVAPQDVDELRRYFAGVVDEVRGLMADLRPEVLDSYGLLAGLEAYCRRMRETSTFKIHMLYELSERLPTYAEVLVYRLVQEALNNVRKHANATKVTVALHTENGSLVVDVRDDGVGFDPNKVPNRGEGFGLGIKSMKERVQSAGGMVRIDSNPGSGTTLTFHIPLPI